MSLDDIFREADAAQARQQQVETERADQLNSAAVADARFASVLKEWLPDAARRLREADVPTRSGGQPKDAALRGWPVYACVPGDAASRDPHGRPGLPPSVKWGQRTSFDAQVGGFSSRSQAMLTVDGGGLVVATTHRLTEDVHMRIVPGNPTYSTSPPVTGYRIDPRLALVGRQLVALSRAELLSLTGLGEVEIAVAAGIDLAILTREPGPTKERILSGQLLVWELGVRRAIAHHAHGLPIF